MRVCSLWDHSLIRELFFPLPVEIQNELKGVKVDGTRNRECDEALVARVL